MRRRADGDAAGNRPGDARLLRRRRRRAGCDARGDEPRCDVEAAGRLHLREQPVRALRRLAHAAGGRGSGRPRGRLRHAGRGRRRQRRARRRGRGRPRARPGAERRRPDVPRDEDVPADAALDARQSPRRPRPRRDRRVGAEGSRAAIRGAAPRGRRARRRARSRDPRRGRGQGRGCRDGRARRRGRELPTTCSPPCSPRTGATRRRLPAASASSPSWARFARRSTSSSPPTRT